MSNNVTKDSYSIDIILRYVYNVVNMTQMSHLKNNETVEKIANWIIKFEEIMEEENKWY